jgi:uncharacterized membrane-anchored protein
MLRQIDDLGWKSAPQSGRISTEATVTLVGDLRYLDTDASSRFLVMNGNPPQAGLYTVAPRIPVWFAILSYDPSGYLRDDETIDPDALLQTLKKNNVVDNEERARLNLQSLTLEGWSVPPHYDAITKRLEWGTKFRSPDGNYTVNYSTRLLGRNGVIHATLVTAPETLDNDVKAFKAALTHIEFNRGSRYAEFRQGDKVAEYGLAALIVGGAAAAAAKSGAGKALFKFIGVGILAAAAAVWSWIKSLFSKKKA